MSFARGPSVMEFDFTADQQRLREDVRAFLASETVPRHWDYWEENADAQVEHRRMAAKLGERGWLAHTWPQRYGGNGRPRIEGLIVSEELSYYGGPGKNRGAISLLGPSLLRFGTEEQKQRFIPNIASGKTFWAQGFSEPGAGSDLAALSTMAIDKGDHFEVTGQKIWTSFAHSSDWIFFLARTGSRESRHKGITYLLAPLTADGIQIKPITYIAGFPLFNEVFFDKLRVPKNDMVGQVNEGWQVAMSVLSDERSGMEYVGPSRRMYDEISGFLKTDGAGLLTPRQLDRGFEMLARLAIDITALRIQAYRIGWMLDQNLDIVQATSAIKTFGADLMWRLARTAAHLLGPFAQLEPSSQSVKLRGRYSREYFGSFARMTAAGSAEIMRNIIATRGLGLPRSG